MRTCCCHCSCPSITQRMLTLQLRELEKRNLQKEEHSGRFAR
ncbi:MULTISPECIES: winged helix-turn-helix transcriptional regulator [Alicyclobacillus]